MFIHTEVRGILKGGQRNGEGEEWGLRRVRKVKNYRKQEGDWPV